MTQTTTGGGSFDIGRVMGQTFSLIGRNAIVFGLLALLLAGAPAFAVVYFQSAALAESGVSDPMQIMQISMLGAIVSGLSALILQAALTRGAIDDLSGRGVQLGAALGAGLRFMLPLLALGIVMGIALVIGFLLLIVPGIILAVRWFVSSPVVVVERSGIFESMGRSAALTKDHRWALFGLLVLFVVFSWIVGAIAASVGGGFAAIQTIGAYSLSYMIALSVGQTLTTLVSTLGVAVAYFELRQAKEGVGIAELASVFD